MSGFLLWKNEIDKEKTFIVAFFGIQSLKIRSENTGLGDRWVLRKNINLKMNQYDCISPSFIEE